MYAITARPVHLARMRLQTQTVAVSLYVVNHVAWYVRFLDGVCYFLALPRFRPQHVALRVSRSTNAGERVFNGRLAVS